MLGNISDCVKKIFLDFTTSLTLGWIFIRIIYIRVYFVAINTLMLPNIFQVVVLAKTSPSQ